MNVTPCGEMGRCGTVWYDPVVRFVHVEVSVVAAISFNLDCCSILTL